MVKSKVNVKTSEYKNGRKRVLRMKKLNGEVLTFDTKIQAKNWIKKQIKPSKYSIVK